jgi:sortase A
MSPGRVLARVLGELSLTAGAVVVLFAAYELGWTNLEAAAAQRELTGDLRRSWSSAVSTAGDSEQARAPATGEGLALLHIPRLGAGWVRPVVQGVAPADLARGVGHYAETALPGEIGNFALAGHRATRGEPLRDLDRLRTGDAVVVETRDAWFTYAVLAAPVVVASTAIEVIAPVPAVPGGRLLTLTTCHPRLSSEKRMIVHATLVEERPHAAGPPTALALAQPGTPPGGA